MQRGTDVRDVAGRNAARGEAAANRIEPDLLVVARAALTRRTRLRKCEEVSY